MVVLYLDDVVAGGIDGALIDGLGDEEEVVSLRKGYHVVHYRPTWRVAMIVPVLLDDLGVDLLVDDNERQLQVIGRQAGIDQGALDGFDLVLDHIRNISVTDTVPREGRCRMS